MAAVPVPPPDYQDVKPFMAWNRLEARPRKRQFERVLKAEVHDPFWSIGRQWQMGEFAGNDTGSGILARVQMDYARLSGVGPFNEPPASYSGNLPLEPLVESIKYNWSTKERLLMGKKWLFFLQQHGLSVTAYKIIFTHDVNFDLTIDTQEPQPQQPPSEPVILEKAKVFSSKPLAAFYASTSLSGLMIDGGKLYEKGIVSSTAILQSLYNAHYSTSIPSGDLTALQGAMNDFMAWVEQMYTLPQWGTSQDHWNSRSMEYQFDAFVPEVGPDNSPDADHENRLSVKGYHQGHFDWYAFEQDQTSYAISPTVPRQVKWLQLLMSENRFAGMPASRWWEFENGGVNFAQIDGNTTDIAKIILTQFALVYQDDWFTIPYKTFIGSYARIQGIVVTDVFGIKTFIAQYNVNDYNANTPTNQIPFTEHPNSWKKWSWMELAKSSNVVHSAKPSSRLLIPPVIQKMQESKPLESVLFIRDEMADLVWGIEKIIPDQLGRGRDGYETSRDYVEYLKLIKPSSSTSSTTIDPDVKLSYELSANNIPENWIPFMPVHTGGSNRFIQLQRASLPRILEPYTISLVRPRTELLRKGISPNGISPLFINEEEVPRAGAIVETSIQRTRWYDGKVVMWVGRRKYTGRGEGASGLTFDTVKDVNGS